MPTISQTWGDATSAPPTGRVIFYVPQERDSALTPGHVVTTKATEVHLINGAINATLEPGTLQYKVMIDGAPSYRGDMVVPETAGPHRLFDLRADYIEYEPPVIGAAQAAAADAVEAAAVAVAAANAAESSAGTTDAEVAPLVANPGDTRNAVDARARAVGDNRYAQSDGTFGLLPATFLRWRKKLAQVRGGTGDARMLCVGDSTTKGLAAVVPLTDSYPARLAAQMNAANRPAYLGLVVPQSQIGGNIAGEPTVWVAGSGWTLDANGWGNASAFKSSSGAGLLTFTSPEQAGTVDRYDLYYVATGGTGPFTVTATGGSATTVTPGTQNGVFKATVSGAGMVGGKVDINCGTSTVRILGVEGWNSTKRRVRVANAGVGSTSSVGWTNNALYGGVPAITAFAPDLTIISLGLNDAGAGQLPAADFKTKMAALITAAKLTGDVLLMTFPPSQVDSNSPTKDSYIPIYYQLAAEMGCGLIDLYKRFTSYAVANPLGYYFDTLHPSTLGYNDIAQAVLAAVTESGTTGSAQPDGLGFGIIATYDPMLAGAVSSGVGTNRTVFTRVAAGGTISKIGFEVVTTDAKNICVSVYRNTGDGRDAKPYVQVGSSGSVACPAVGYAEVPLTAATRVLPGDWLALTTTDNVAKFRGALNTGIVSDLWKGRAAYGDIGLPPPAVVTTGIFAAAIGHILLIGIP